MNFSLKYLVAATALAVAGQASAQVLFYEQPDFQGRSVTTDKALDDFVRAVLGTPAQRCWTEREKVQGNNNQVPAALAGALIGGILGHQVGGGAGKNLATAGGVVAGAAVGANLGRNNSESTTRDVQRCDSNPVEAKAAYWDVTYNFRGQEHHVQMASPPRNTITVNARGEPRA